MKRRRRTARRRPRLTPFLAVGFLAAALAAGFLLSSQNELVVPATSPPPAAPPASDYVLKLNGPVTPSSAGVLMAISDGLFQREGLTLRLQRGTGDADVLSTVTDGDRVLGLVSAEGFLKARAKGLPVVAFAASYIVSSVEFFALAGTRLQSPADLQGKRIGYKPDSEIPVMLYALIAANTIAQAGMAIVESEHALADLREGRIDVLIGHREVEGQALDNADVPYRSLSPDSFGVHLMGPVYFANERAFSRLVISRASWQPLSTAGTRPMRMMIEPFQSSRAPSTRD